jgi:hypothetical protein
MNVLEYILRAKDDTGAGLATAKQKLYDYGNAINNLTPSASAKSKLAEYSQTLGGIGQAANGAGSGLVSMIKKFAGPAAIIATVVAGLKKAFGEFSEFEKLQAQFETLLGSLDKAKQRMAEVQNFKVGASGGLFDEKDIAQASMNLEKLTSGVLGGKAAWKMIGDVAAGTGNTMESVSFAVGKAFGQIAEGMPTDRAMMQLQQLGVLGPETIKTLKDLEDAGGTLAQKWEVVSAALEKYNGGMEKIKATSVGALAELKSAWNEMFQNVGEKLKEWNFDAPIRGLTAGIKRISERRIFDRVSLGGNIDELLAQSKAEEDAAQEKLTQEKRVQDELAKRQAEIDKKLAEEKAHQERLLGQKLSDEAFTRDIEARKSAFAEAKKLADEAERKRKEDLRYSMQDTAAGKIDSLEANKEKQIKALDAAIDSLGEKAKSAAEKLRTATSWLAEWGGQAGGEFGARGSGRREWVAGKGAARDSNAQQAAQDKIDHARSKELQQRLERNIRLSPEDKQWRDDQIAWQTRKNENEANAKNAAAMESQAKAELAAKEEQKTQIAQETRDACKGIREDLAQTLRAI